MEKLEKVISRREGSFWYIRIVVILSAYGVGTWPHDWSLGFPKKMIWNMVFKEWEKEDDSKVGGTSRGRMWRRRIDFLELVYICWSKLRQFFFVNLELLNFEPIYLYNGQWPAVLLLLVIIFVIGLIDTYPLNFNTQSNIQSTNQPKLSHIF